MKASERKNTNAERVPMGLCHYESLEVEERGEDKFKIVLVREHTNFQDQKSAKPWDRGTAEIHDRSAKGGGKFKWAGGRERKIERA